MFVSIVVNFFCLFWDFYRDEKSYSSRRPASAQYNETVLRILSQKEKKC